MKQMTSTLKIALFFLMTVVLTACGGGGGGGGSSSGGSDSNTDDANIITELKLSPTDSTILRGKELIMSAQAIYADGSSKNVTQSAKWASSDAKIVTFKSDRPNVVVTGEELGSASITATFDGVKSATTVTVSSPELLSLTLSNDKFDLALGETSEIQAKGTYLGGFEIDVTKDVSWTSANKGIATVSNEKANAGLIAGTGIGSTTVSASLDGKSSSNATVKVVDAVVSSIAISADNANIFEGDLAKLTASATYSDGSSKDVTKQVTWKSDSPSIASVSDATTTKGFVSALSPGSASISAKLGEISAETSLTIVVAPNKPGALTLQAIPNVILNNGLDKSVVTTTVLPKDPTNGVIADGTIVDFTQSSSDLVLTPTQSSTVSGEVIKQATSSIEGRYNLIAEVAGTTAIDDVEIRVVTSFSEVINMSAGSAGSSNIDGQIQPGGVFIGEITNTSNRIFDIKKAILFNGSNSEMSITDTANLSGGKLEAGEVLSVRFDIKDKLPNKGFYIEFEMEDAIAATPFTVQRSFNAGPLE